MRRNDAQAGFAESTAKQKGAGPVSDPSLKVMRRMGGVTTPE